jgi:acetyl esterase/lipase
MVTTSEDKVDHSSLAYKLASFTRFPVVLPNYRLTPTEEGHLRHPAHAEDILQFLSFLIVWKGLQGLGPPYDPRKIYLMGHSCGAHILASIFLDSSSSSPTLAPSAQLFGAVRIIVMSEGIYDFDLLLSSFPAYREWFLQAAFGKSESYAKFSVTEFPLRTLNPRIKWLVIHSKGDTLVDMAQSETVYRHLCQLHSAVSTDSLVARNVDELEEGHNEILSSDRFVRIVGDFLLTDHFGQS